MTCPRCFFKTDKACAACPECGLSLFQNISGIIRTSAVLISTRDEDSFYQSVQEVPEPLRRRLIETTASENSGTIVIADRAGKEQLTQVLARREAHRERLSDEALPDIPAEEPPPPLLLERLPWLAWAGFLIVLAAAAGISAFFGLRW